MKSLSFNQLHLRILSLIFVLFSGAILGYRFFVERPQLEWNMAKFAQRELATLRYSFNKTFDELARFNYDYAVWTSTYDFMVIHDEDYIEENLLDDTFISLGIDGIFYIDENYQTVFAKGFDHLKEQELSFLFYEFDALPENKNMLPDPTLALDVPQTTGMLLTENGPAIFSATQIRRSDKSGGNKGYLIFIKLFEQSIIDELSSYTLTDINVSEVTPDVKKLNLPSWDGDIDVKHVTKFSRLLVNDFNNEPILLLTMKHSNSTMPPILDLQSFVFILLFSLLIYIVYSVISLTIIKPVRKLAEEIKSMDNDEDVRLLSETSYISELGKISKHFNALVMTIQRQNALLAQQVYVDVLTGITNRRGFEEHLEKQIQNCIRQNTGFTIIMADVDHFKKYNDSLGHLEGDNALFEVAQTLNSHFKRANDLCARYGGEEFIMLFAEFNADLLENKLQQILDSITALNLPHPDSPTAAHITVSLGACIVVPDDVVNFELPVRKVLRVADSALYQAKANGRNQYVVLKFSDVSPAD